ncbi:hypothetical protein MNEG_0388 [Monoraphidium neglectum]|uniref:GAF domain-containing protein n=1 Tax=Monoraphidium neglectum TaxID=145388 RepID=A0A0D2KBP7_9CHLO|nr:hypothetical protein MNEG_0388 [Monoraphidium neglectum]KIZ07573.1 hypothetical protein MNEG_0388 [Monoraphidium neglectum]|eukprot:XP_013906592.1 hypothetical protein MNEG_0388 [Monoraphidium neglectum]
MAQPPEVKGRLSRAVAQLNTLLGAGGAASGRGALIQVWMPSQLNDGSTVLSAQGLPFAVAGVGDLLALFRCVSCRYRFSTDTSKPALMGAIGRVYASCEPEMCNDVQKYDKQVYLRVTEAQRCRVHSTLVMPVFDAADASTGAQQPVAVFEVVQSGQSALFPEMLEWLSASLQARVGGACGVDAGTPK